MKGLDFTAHYPSYDLILFQTSSLFAIQVKFIGDFVSASNSPLAKSQTVRIVGAGHSPSLVVKAIKQGLLSAKALVAVAPTWAGPLPIVFGREPKVQNR